jgi:DNA-binding PadR family transcriptional regulator
MALKHAVLAVLLDGPASGYDLAKRFDRSVANFWHATRQQLYAELGRLEAEGLVRPRLVRQRDRPDKRLFRVTPSGARLMRNWVGGESRPTAIKDEMLVRVQAASAAEAPAVLRALGPWRADRASRLEAYLHTRERLLAGQTEERYLAAAERPGGYLTLARGIALERENLAWAEAVRAALTRRGKRTERANVD